MVQTENTIKEWAKGRYAIYTYLADCYLDIPSEETVRRAAKFAPLFSTLAESTNETMQAASGLFNAFAAEAASTDNMPGLLEKLNMEYTALFMMGDLSIPFFESAFLGGTDTQKSEIRMEVYHFFARRQFERRGPLNIPEDALCHELDYMAKMSALVAQEENAETVTALIAEQYAFITEHLGKWVDAFGRRTQEKAEREKSLFYKAVTAFTAAFVQFDQEILRSLTEEA